MARTILIIVSLVAAVHAGFVWTNDNENNFSPFQHIRMPIMPRLPTLPIMPTPPIPPKAPRFPFGGFQMPFIPLPKIPTAAEMASVKPGPNQVYNGVAVKSSSSFTRDKDGKLVRTGGTHILVNDNGEVQEEKFGTRPPNLNDPIVFPSVRFY
uniref:Seroin transcript 1A n=1 Tax=Ostrinia nubilalis TaxID=29057 RepID=A0A493QWE1_OSTNU|nr:seroin transcript 1A [Ostrinia nubilalis]